MHISLDDVPYKFIISSDKLCSNEPNICKQELVRPYKRCNSGECNISSKCKKFVNSPYNFEPCVFDTNLSSCREPKGIPLYDNYSLTEINIDTSNNNLSYRINDYPSKNTIRITNDYDIYHEYSYATGIEGAWFGECKTKFQNKHNLNNIKLYSYVHHKITSNICSYSPETLEIYFIASIGLLFKSKIDYKYTITFDWRTKLMYAELYKNNIKIDTSKPHSLNNI